MTYEECVEEAKEATKNYQWTIGMLALKVEKYCQDHSLREYANDINIPYKTLMDYRRVVAAYEFSGHPENLPWTYYQHAAAQPDRVELVQRAAEEDWSTHDLRTHIQHRQLPIPEECYEPKTLTPIILQEAANHAVNDPTIWLRKIETDIHDLADAWEPGVAREAMEERHSRSTVQYHVEELQACIDVLTEFKEVFQGLIARGIKHYEAI